MPSVVFRLLPLLLFCLMASACAKKKAVPEPDQPLAEGFAYWSCLENDTVYSPVSLAELRANADSGNSAAMTALGDLAATREMYNEAVKWFLRAAQQGYAPAYLLAGEYLPDAPELVENVQAESLAYLRKAAEHGTARAPFLFLQRSLRANAPLPKEDVVRWLPKVMESHDPDDMQTIWELVSQSEHSKLRPLFLQTVSSYTKRAAQGDAGAAWILYLLQHNGIAVTHSPELAKAYLTKAAAGGSPEALYQAYTENPADTALLLSAASKGYIPALLKAGEEYGVGKDHLPRDREKARAYFEEAARQGNSRATYLLGLLWAAQIKDNTPGAAEESFRWYEKAANMGSSDAFRKLSGCYQSGTGVSQNSQLANYWSRIAQNANNPVPAGMEHALVP
ncbi:hypothetical protein LJC46_01205 [Desulfovibrio sp. OttesenSCG-928-G15]|nr:hypothetical protein [Desulfovibrio sp. OttesenSCG-928-G15]